MTTGLQEHYLKYVYTQQTNVGLMSTARTSSQGTCGRTGPEASQRRGGGYMSPSRTSSQSGEKNIISRNMWDYRSIIISKKRWWLQVSIKNIISKWGEEHHLKEHVGLQIHKHLKEEVVSTVLHQEQHLKVGTTGPQEHHLKEHVGLQIHNDLKEEVVATGLHQEHHLVKLSRRFALSRNNTQHLTLRYQFFSP